MLTILILESSSASRSSMVAVRPEDRVAVFLLHPEAGGENAYPYSLLMIFSPNCVVVVGAFVAAFVAGFVAAFVASFAFNNVAATATLIFNAFRRVIRLVLACGVTRWSCLSFVAGLCWCLAFGRRIGMPPTKAVLCIMLSVPVCCVW